MATPLRVPPLVVGPRRWSADEVEARASHWRVRIDEALGRGRLAVAVTGGVDGVALVTAAAARPDWFIVLPPDVRFWRQLALPTDLVVALPPSLAEHVPAVRAIGARALVLPEDLDRRDLPALDVLRSEGIVLFTSGSTGNPKPVYRPMARVLAAVRARLGALNLRPGEGTVAGASLGHGHGFTRLVSAMCLGGPLALLDPLDYRTALRIVAEPEYGLWSPSVHFADVLGRCRLTGPAVVPRVCLVSTSVPMSVFQRFLDRFGVPLRQNYSSTETGSIAVDYGPADEVCPETVGRPLAGVEVRTGETPDLPTAENEAGRIWVRSPWRMGGYGRPPELERPGELQGWWPTQDVGYLRSDGRLVLLGRRDDCIRTREGRLVNLEEIANWLRSVGGIRDAAVVPINGDSGVSFGAVVVCARPQPVEMTRRNVSETLPDWAWPRALVHVPSLPRLTSGKVDRQRCVSLLSGGG